MVRALKMKVKRRSFRLKVIQVDKKYYDSVLNTLDEDRRNFLDKEIIADKYYLVFSGLPIAGFATNSNGRLTGLFSKKKGIGDKIFPLRLKQSIEDSKKKELILECIGDKLKKFYSTYGFKVLYASRWNDELAPPSWDYDKFGRPNIYTMSYNVSL